MRQPNFRPDAPVNVPPPPPAPAPRPQPPQQNPFQQREQAAKNLQTSYGSTPQRATPQNANLGQPTAKNYAMGMLRSPNVGNGFPTGYDMQRTGGEVLRRSPVDMSQIQQQQQLAQAQNAAMQANKQNQTFQALPANRPSMLRRLG